jgi:hypothetical protein
MFQERVGWITQNTHIQVTPAIITAMTRPPHAIPFAG